MLMTRQVRDVIRLEKINLFANNPAASLDC